MGIQKNKRSGSGKLPFVIAGISVVVALILFVIFLTGYGSVNTSGEEEKYAEAELVEQENVTSEENGSKGENTQSDNQVEKKEENASKTVTADKDMEEAGATGEDDESPEGDTSADGEAMEGDSPSDAGEKTSKNQAEDAADNDATDEMSEAQTENSSDAGEGTTSNSGEQDALQAVASSSPSTGGHLIVIDPGHQTRGNSDKEPNGPGASTMKAKVTGGTSGPTSGLSEYQLTLTIGLKLRDELVNRGYTVIMTRETNDVDISNVERAQIANNAGAEAFIRIHANGSEDTSVNGAMTICQTASNPYNSAYYAASRKLSDCVLEAFVSATGCKKQYVWETDTMTGINWANVPSTIIEMGYMTNPTEDSNMASESYQQLMVSGIANGIDNYFVTEQ